jgi:hypothetical protein
MGSTPALGRGHNRFPQQNVVPRLALFFGRGIERCRFCYQNSRILSFVCSLAWLATNTQFLCEVWLSRVARKVSSAVQPVCVHDNRGTGRVNRGESTANLQAHTEAQQIMSQRVVRHDCHQR